MSGLAFHAVAYRLLCERIHRPLAEWFGGASGSAKSAQMLTLAVGFFTYRLLYALDIWQGELEPTSREWLEQAFQ